MGNYNQSKPQSWWDNVAKSRETEKERVSKGLPPRLAPPVVDGRENIKCSKEFADYLATHQQPVDEKGNALPTSERGKRRRVKKNGG